MKLDEYISKEYVLSCVDDFLSKTDMPIAAQFFYDCFRECEVADIKILKREKWKKILEILRDAMEDLEYYETHGDILDRHIWKYKNEVLALIGEEDDAE